ncbi:hypothetical protein [Leucobacter chromiireducens]|uniref:hypothetical protein n=1 Tax=Leucobacter chromiireducens TaxID=283877 RepID=UPI000F62E745|nr:hypothetical protein [Leucobacter chromiireducens]
MSAPPPPTAAADRLALFRREWPGRISWAEVRAAEPRVFWRAAAGAALLLPAAGALLAWTSLTGEFPVAITLPAWLEWARGGLVVGGFWLVLLLGVFAAILLDRPRELRRELAFRRFAAARGLSYARLGATPPARGLFFAEPAGSAPGGAARRRRLGQPAAPGDTARFRANFALSSTEPPAWPGAEPELQLAVASFAGGKNDPRGPLGGFRYLQLRAPRQLPHLVIDWLANGKLSEFLAGSQRLSLEGDFDRNFACYAPAGYARDALELLTPDVMAVLIDHGRHWDIEVVEDRILVVSRRVLGRWDRAETTALLLFAEVLGGELGHQARHYTDPRADRPRVQVAAPGQRLARRSRAWVGAVVCAVGAALLAFPFVLGWLLDLS